MNNSENIIEKIKLLSSTVKENTYDSGIKQAYECLVKLHDLGVDKESVYQSLFQYHNRLEDGLSRDFIADILDYVVGWCSPHSRIW